VAKAGKCVRHGISPIGILFKKSDSALVLERFAWSLFAKQAHSNELLGPLQSHRDGPIRASCSRTGKATIGIVEVQSSASKKRFPMSKKFVRQEHDRERSGFKQVNSSVHQKILHFRLFAQFRLCGPIIDLDQPQNGHFGAEIVTAIVRHTEPIL